MPRSRTSNKFVDSLLARERCLSCGTPVAKACLHAGRCAECSDHHNLSKGEYRRLLNDQAGRCAICVERPLYADHDHASGASRGLLCNPCNSGLGMFNDSFERFERAVAYLLKYRERHFAVALSGFSSMKTPNEPKTSEKV